MAFSRVQDQQPKTLFGAELQRLMREKGMSLNDLAEKVGGSYEYARRLVRGEGTPSIYYARSAAAVFGVDVAGLEALIKQDKFQKNYGSIMEAGGAAATPLPPDLAQFHRAWPLLDDNQKGALLQMLKAFTAQSLVAAGSPRRS